MPVMIPPPYPARRQPGEFTRSFRLMLVLLILALPALGQEMREKGNMLPVEENNETTTSPNAPQILTSDLTQRMTAESEPLEVSFVFADSDSVTRVLINGQKQKINPGDTVALTTRIPLNKGSNLVEVIATDQAGNSRTKTFLVEYAGTLAESQLPAWRMKWIGSLGLGALSLYYASTQGGQVNKSNAAMQDLISKLKATNNMVEFNNLKAQYDGEKSKAEKARGNAVSGVVLAGLFAGVAAWIYLDPPTQDGTALAPTADPETGAVNLAYEWRW
ncbi:MAG: hypothetical protein OEW12_07195 [Deltaproteobacteria bacterium]|nr:hypothetical protein [Deltaproteobacteria bacterium]